MVSLTAPQGLDAYWADLVDFSWSIKSNTSKACVQDIMFVLWRYLDNVLYTVSCTQGILFDNASHETKTKYTNMLLSANILLNVPVNADKQLETKRTIHISRGNLILAVGPIPLFM